MKKTCVWGEPLNVPKGKQRFPAYDKRFPHFIHPLSWTLGFPGVSVVNNLPANAGNIGDTGLIPGSGRYPGEVNGNPYQYSCLGNPMQRGAW